MIGAIALHYVSLDKGFHGPRLVNDTWRALEPLRFGGENASVVQLHFGEP